MFDLGGSFGIDLGAMGEGGGFFGSGVYDPGADAFRRSNEGQLRLQDRSQQQSNRNTLAFDRSSFAQKMALANEFGINKLSMLGVPSSSGSSPSYVSTGQANFSGSAAHSVKADPQEAKILDNNVRISDANARMAEAQAKLSELDVKARSNAALSVGRPPAARVSNDKADSVLRTVKVGDKDFQLANPSVLPEQYNYGENFTALVNSGVDPRLALSLSATELTNPTSLVAPLLTVDQLGRERLPDQNLSYYQALLLGLKPHSKRTYKIIREKGGK